MINSLEHARGIIEQWYDEVTITQHEPSIENLPSIISQAADYIAMACNSEDEIEQRSAIKTLFAGLVEVWNDSFSMRGRNAYACIFGHIVWQACSADCELKKGLRRFGIKSEADLLERHHRVRKNGYFDPPDQARCIVVLSRVTIGADILLTNVLLQRLQQKYPDTRIVVMGDKKLGGLFGGMRNVEIKNIDYSRRGTLSTRLRSWLTLCDCITHIDPDFVVAPDSRLDQLGILPVIRDEQYALWENLQTRDKTESLSVLVDEWACERFDLDTQTACYPRLAFDQPTRDIADQMQNVIQERPFIAVKLDYGGNEDKAVSRDWEVEILRSMIDRGWGILIDRGFGEDELKNSDAIMRGIGRTPFDISAGDKERGTLIKHLKASDIDDQAIVRFYGSIAAWAACANACQLAFSYDSVGHHLAAALNIPVVIAFTGYKDDNFPSAWEPRGEAAVNMVCIPKSRKNSRSYLDKILDHITKLTTRVTRS